MSFKYKIFLVLFMISIVPYTIIMILFGDTFREEQKNYRMHELQTQLNITKERITTHLQRIRSDIDFIAHSDIMNDLIANDLDRRISIMLQRKKRDLALFGDFHIMNLAHEIVASSNPVLIGEKAEHNALFKTRIQSSFKKNLGTLYIEYQLDNLKQFFTPMPFRQYYIKITTSQEVFKTKHFDKSFIVETKLPQPLAGTLFLEEDKEYTFQSIEKLEKWFLGLLLVGIIVILILSLLLANRLIRPISALSKTALSISSTQNYKQKVATPVSKDEIGDLTQAFNTLIQSVDSALEHNADLTKEIEETQREVIFTMGNIGETHSLETGNHVKRVAEYSAILANHYGMDKEHVEMLRLISPMHDIGKIAIPDSILKKPAKLTPDEMSEMQKHAEYGYKMLNCSKRPLLKMAATISYQHHEKWDGSGYPQGLAQEEIHIFGRITALADIFDALGSKRVYKDAWSNDEIFAYIKEQKGITFDPDLVDIFFDHLDEFLAIRSEYKDKIQSDLL